MQLATTSSSNTISSEIKTVRLADGTHTLRTVSSPGFGSANIQKVIVPTKGNISLEQIKKLIGDCSNPDSLSKIIIKTSNNSNNNNNFSKDDHGLLSGKPVVINARSVELEKCIKDLEETKSKLQEAKSLAEKLQSQLDEKGKNLQEMEKKHSEINAKYTKLLEENEEMKEKIDKLSSSTPVAVTTPVKKDTRSSTNVQNNQNSCSMKTRGVRVALVKNKS